MDIFSDESDQEAQEAGIFSDDDENSDSSNVNLERQKLQRINYHAALNETDFIFRFRLDKITFQNLLTKIYPKLSVTSSRNNGIPPLHQLLLTLRFYALGTVLISVGDFIGVSKTSASRIVADVSQAIASLYPEYVKMVENPSSAFYDIAGFPRVLGAIDCTHIHIQSPDSNIGEEFRNRKGFFSINVQGVCNAELIFMNVVARWPGSAHDATIFNNSILKMQCEDGVFGNKFLLGDSAYPCTSYLMTPLLNPVSPAEQRYNQAHIKTRNTIERCFGVWKRRFPVLSLKLRLALRTTQAIIIATSVLHNICRQNSIIEVNPEVAVPEIDSNAEFNGTGPQNAQGRHVRQELINNNFDRV